MQPDNIKILLERTKKLFERTLSWFSKEISSLRSSHLSPDFIKDVSVEYYGTRVSLREIASLSLVDSKTISIEPWDKSSISNIERALYDSELGGNVKNEGDRILFIFSMLTQEDKEKVVKVLREKVERAKIGLRNIRNKSWQKIQEMERKSEISEDEKFKGKEELQKLLDEFEEKIEKIKKAKEKEITGI